MEGAVFPPTLKTERKFDRKGMQTGTFGMVLGAFIKNAEPDADATAVIIDTANLAASEQTMGYGMMGGGMMPPSGGMMGGSRPSGMGGMSGGPMGR